jgi:hypothetical protein
MAIKKAAAAVRTKGTGKAVVIDGGPLKSDCSSLGGVEAANPSVYTGEPARYNGW